MSIDLAGATNTSSTTSTTSTTGRWSRWRWGLAVALLVGLAALIMAISAPDSGDSAQLGPANPAPKGSRAVVQVLIRQGVDVRVRGNSQDAVSSTDGRSTLLVTNTRLLGPDQLDRLAADDLAELILVEPDDVTLARLAPDVHAAGRVEAEVRDPGCAVPAALAAGSARAGGFSYSRSAEPARGSTPPAVCYPADGEPDGEGSYLVQTRPGRKITVIGQSDLLTNQYLDDDGNAALALTTLGEQPRLIWYTPDPLEPSGGHRVSLVDLLPDWVLWVVIQLAVAVLVTMLWRGRRLGRLVPEPLPVVVRAAETQEGRARLYRQASARGRVAATLRTTTLRRLAARLAVPAGTTPQQLVSLLAAATGREERALHALLLGPAPDSDDTLIQLADNLDAVQQDLSHDQSTLHPAQTDPARIDLKGSPL
jgi:hypothetical protein